jgi:hypothetical protein
MKAPKYRSKIFLEFTVLGIPTSNHLFADKNPLILYAGVAFIVM